MNLKQKWEREWNSAKTKRFILSQDLVIFFLRNVRLRSHQLAYQYIHDRDQDMHIDINGCDVVNNFANKDGREKSIPDQSDSQSSRISLPFGVQSPYLTAETLDRWHFIINTPNPQDIALRQDSERMIRIDDKYDFNTHLLKTWCQDLILIIINQNSITPMEGLKCPVIEHQNYPIEGICMNKECTAESKLICLYCIRQNTLKVKVYRDEFQAIKTQMINQLNQLELQMNELFEEEIQKHQALQQIELILNANLTKMAWVNGHSLLINQDKSIYITQESLSSEMTTIKQSLQSLINVVKQSMIKEKILCDWNIATKEKRFVIKSSSICYTNDQIACSLDGKYFGVSNSSSIEIWDLQKGLKVKTLQGHSGVVTTIEFSECGCFIVSGSLDKTVRVWDIETMKQIGGNLEGHLEQLLTVQYSIDQKHILSGSLDKTIRMWNIESSKEIESKRFNHEQPLSCYSPIQFSPDRNHVLVGDTSGKIMIYDFNNKKQFGNPLVGHTAEVLGSKYSPDGKLIVSTGRDLTIRIWSSETQTQIGNNLIGHTGSWILPVMFSPDMKYVVSGGDDKTVRIWDYGSGKQVGTNLSGHPAYVYSAKFSPDGRNIMSAGAGGHVQISLIDC